MAARPRDLFRWVSERRTAPLLLSLLAFALALPALRVGLFGDDYFQRIVLAHIGEAGAAARPLRDLFTFVPRGDGAAMQARGYLPWWSDTHMHIAFARPLTALTHVLDYALWPNNAVLQHLHSLLWFALSVGLVALLFRRLFPSHLTATLAGLCFALEDAHAMGVGWLANRNALPSLVAGTAVVLLHVEWRRSRRPLHLGLAILALGVGLGFGEATLGALAYVLAWQIACDEGGLSQRLTPLLPYGLVVAVWRVLYEIGGYGASGSSLYIDPGAHPLEFAFAVIQRWPLLAAAQWFQIPADIWILLPSQVQVILSALAAAAIVALVRLLWPLLRRSPLARFWAIGMAFSLVPVGATFPMDRLLIFAGIGAFGLLAMLCEATGTWPFPAVPSRPLARGCARGLLILHVPLAALLLVFRIITLPIVFGDEFASAERSAPRDPEVARQTFVFVNGNDFPVVYCSVIREATGDAPVPKRLALLGPMTGRNHVVRKDAETLVITPEGGFLSRPVDRLLASPSKGFATGERIDLPDYTVEVESVTRDLRPLCVAFRFRRPLENPSLRWLYWKGRRLQPFPLPGIGEEVTVEPVPLNP